MWGHISTAPSSTWSTVILPTSFSSTYYAAIAIVKENNYTTGVKDLTKSNFKIYQNRPHYWLASGY